MYNLASYNCKSIKRSVESVRQLCSTSDIVALQETWLLPHNISFLNEVDTEFGCTGTSAVDTTAGMLRGRPFGGVGLLWRKNVFDNVSVVQCDNPRVCAIKVCMKSRSFLVFSVYMPIDNSVNLTDFTDCLSLVSAIINSNDIETAFVLGDFNSHPNEQFYNELVSFCRESELLCADVELLGVDSDTYTFISEANGSTRWLDHCVATRAAMSTILNVTIKYDVLWSDHFPLIIQCNLNEITPKFYKSINDDYKNRTCNKIKWGNRKLKQIDIYTKYCNVNLKDIDFPIELSACSDYVCNNLDHRIILDTMYDDIVNILGRAASEGYEINHVRNKKPIMGWNKHVGDAHRQARLKFEQWVSYGRPSEGRFWNDMQMSRKIFKSRLRWCQNNSDQIKMDMLASHHSRGDFRSFWKSTNKLNSRPGLPVSVSGVANGTGIAELFRQHFTVSSSLGPSQFTGSAGCSGQESSVRFTAKQVRHVIMSMSRGKSPGHDNLSIEHLKHAGRHLPRVLAMFYSLCVGHS